MARRAKRRFPSAAADGVGGSPTHVQWSDVGPADFRPRQAFLRLTPGLTHAVRLFHRPVRFWRRPDGRGVTVISEDEARAVGAAAACRNAINVIDRADQQTKVLEGPEALFLEFRRCYELTRVAPGGPDGFDFGIDLAVVGASRVYRLTYDSERPTPFTAREKDALKMGRFDLSAILAARPHSLSSAG